MTENERLSPSMWAREDEARSQFERAWQAGPPISRFLGSTAGNERSRLVQELVRLDMHYRRVLSLPATEADYLASLPEEAAAVRDFFACITLPGPETRSEQAPSSTVRQTNMPAAGGSLPRWSAPRFRSIRSFAKGGLGEVFLAEDLEFRREVALKEIQFGKHLHPSARSDFSREAMIAGQLEHPNIAPVYSLGEFDDGRPFYVMRFIRGGSLKDAISQLHATTTVEGSGGSANSGDSAFSLALIEPASALRLRQLLARFVQVCNAVAFAHSKGIIHRDIKPANIMLGDFGETLLVDWGLARPMQQPAEQGGISSMAAKDTPDVLQGGTQTGQIKGTPAYMSPEQAKGDIAQLGPATDVYSLGATLYTLLTGLSPVDGKSSDEVLSNVTSGRITPPRARTPERRIAKPLEAICVKAMALAPTDRYASAQSLAADLERFLADEPVTAYREPIVVQAQRWFRKHRALSLATAAVLLLALLAGPVWAMRENRLRLEADANFASAQGAVERYVDTVENATLLREPRFKPLAIELLDDAQRFFANMVAQNADRPERRAALAAAQFQVGRLGQQRGDVENAMQAYQSAIREFEALLQDNPHDVSLQSGLARSYSNLGLLQRETAWTTEARGTLNKAIRLARQLVNQQPEVAQYQDTLAESLTRLGKLQRDAGEFAEARVSFSEAVATGEKLAANTPKTTEFQRRLADSLAYLGTMELNLANLEAAEAAYLRSIAISERLVAANPMVAEFQFTLAHALNDYGVCLDITDREAQAREKYARSLAINEKIATDNPTVAEYLSATLNNHLNLGSSYAVQGSNEVAHRHYQQAVAAGRRLVAENATLEAYKVALADTLANYSQLQFFTGDSAAARQGLEEAHTLYTDVLINNQASAGSESGLAFVYTRLAAIAGKEDSPQAAHDYLIQAEPHHRKLLAMNPRQADYRDSFCSNRALLAETCLKLGAHAECIQSAKECGEYADTSEVLVEVAVYASACIPLAKQDEGLSANARQKAAMEYGDAAMELLRKAVAAGLTDPSALNRPEFLPLTLREDYRELIGSLTE